MKCFRCPGSSDGYAVIPGIGELGEIRFYCDSCARRDRVKMRYWDGRDLEMGGWRESPDLGPSFHNVILSFADLIRMRPEDVKSALSWVEDSEIATALSGADPRLLRAILSSLPPPRVARVRKLLDSPQPGNGSPSAAQALIVSVIRRL